MGGTIMRWRICFAFHPEKRPSWEQKNMLEAKIAFKSLVSSGQILDTPSSPGAQANSSTLDYYIFGASGEVVSSAAVRRA